MKTSLLRLPAAALLLAALSQTLNAADREISREALLDKIRGAWAGQMIGVSYGAATEFRSQGKIHDVPIKPEPLDNAINQDDLYVEMTFARVMDFKGIDAKATDYGDAFRESQYNLWHANAGARRNLNRGLQPPLSGHPDYNLHADDIDFQIEADFIGIMCPGLPRLSNKLADRIGHVMNYGDGVYGGMFVGGMYAAGYFEKDPRKLVEAGLACLPAKSTYAQIIQDLLDFHARNTKDWRAAWKALQDKWDKNDPCPDGALQAFNIDAKLNGAYIAVGLLYGEGDLEKTMEISTRCGQDSDCNPSSAAGILGAVAGYSGLPEKYRAELDRLAEKKFAFTEYSFNDIVVSTEKRALTAIRDAGGKVNDTTVTVPLQKPRAARLEQCQFGTPAFVLQPDDAAWKWTGSWTKSNNNRTATTAGCEAELTFTGTGVALTGKLAQDGGLADIYLDGKKQKLLADAYIPERTHDNDLWHKTGLKDGKHTLRLVTRPDAHPASKGNTIILGRAVVYR